MSDAFEIAASRFGALEPLYAVADEWRTRDALEGAPAVPPAGNLDAEEDTPEVASADRQANEPETPPAAQIIPSRDEAAGAASTDRPDPSSATAPVSSRAPLPLRL